MTTQHEAPALPEGPASGRQSRTIEAAATAPSKASRGPRKSKAARKSFPPSKNAKRAKQAKEARKGSKTAKIVALLQRPNGASLPELIRATGWQPHSVRGFLSGTVAKQLGLSIASVKDLDGTRRYSVKS